MVEHPLQPAPGSVLLTWLSDPQLGTGAANRSHNTIGSGGSADNDCLPDIMRIILLILFGMATGHIHAFLFIFGDDRYSPDLQGYIYLSELLAGAVIGGLTDWLWERIAKWQTARCRLDRRVVTESEGIWPPPPNRPSA